MWLLQYVDVKNDLNKVTVSLHHDEQDAKRYACFAILEWLDWCQDTRLTDLFREGIIDLIIVGRYNEAVACWEKQFYNYFLIYEISISDDLTDKTLCEEAERLFRQLSEPE